MDLSEVLWTTWEAGASIYTLIAAALWGHAEVVRWWVERGNAHVFSELLRWDAKAKKGWILGLKLLLPGYAWKLLFFLKKGSCFVRFKNKCKASHPKMLLFLLNDSDYQRVLMGKRRSCIIAWSGFNCSVGESRLTLGLLRFNTHGDVCCASACWTFSLTSIYWRSLFFFWRHIIGFPYAWLTLQSIHCTARFNSQQFYVLPHTVCL